MSILGCSYFARKESSKTVLNAYLKDTHIDRYYVAKRRRIREKNRSSCFHWLKLHWTHSLPPSLAGENPQTQTQTHTHTHTHLCFPCSHKLLSFSVTGCTNKRYVTEKLGRSLGRWLTCVSVFHSGGPTAGLWKYWCSSTARHGPLVTPDISCCSWQPLCLSVTMPNRRKWP